MTDPSVKGSKRRRLHGFTLLEVLVSLALIAALLGSMFAFLFDMLSSRERALEASRRRLAAATLIELVEADLLICLVGDRRTGAGIRGDSTTLTILRRGVATHLADRGLDDPAVLGDLQATEYRFNEASGLIEARRHAPGRPASRGPDGFAPLGSVYKVRFRYHDSASWRDSFDSLAEDALPSAVEVAMWFRPWPGAAPLAGDQDEAEPLRLTFDAAGGFDDAESARLSDLDDIDEPRPDRFRVILIPDGSTDDPYGNELPEGASGDEGFAP